MSKIISLKVRALRISILLSLFSFFSFNSFSQEMWGISNSNFAGNMGIFLNPSTFVFSPYKYEFNLIAADGFGQNAHVYTLENEKSLFHSITGSVWRDTTENKNELQNTFTHTLVIGPSFLRNKDSWGWGVHTAYRTEFSTQNMTQSFVNSIYHHPEPLTPGPQINAAFSTNYATWLELGGTYGSVIQQAEHNLFKWAANVNLLAGLSGYSVDADAFDYTIIDTSTTIVHRSQMIINEAMNTSNQSIFGIHGAGLSSTIGLVYIKKLNRGAFDCTMSNDNQTKYKYRLGVSLLDVGVIHYFNNSKVTTIDNSSNVTWNGLDSLETRSIKTIDQALATELGGKVEEKSFNIWLPLAASLQFDYQIRQNVFANLSTINRIRFKNNMIARGNQVNLSARYERRRFEATLSASLFEYEKTALGLGLRYRWIVIGTDRLLEFMGLSDNNNYDFYFGLKIQFCKKPFSPGPDCPAYGL